MDREKQAQELLAKYQQLHQADPQIDVATLAMDALAAKPNRVTVRWRAAAYFISLAFPPLGLLLAVRFYFGSEDDAKMVGHVCVGLTAVSVIFLIILVNVLVSGSGLAPADLEQINPQDLQNLLE